MCQFLSAIVSKNGEVYCDPFIDSHEELIQRFGLRDDQSQFINNIVRVEFTPKDDDYFDIENYTLRIDEDSEPDWWASVKDSVHANLKDRIQRMIIDKADNKVLCGGVYFVRDSKILWTRYSRILVVKDATIHNVRGNATIQCVGGNATIHNVWDNATIHNVRGNATIQYVRDNATIQYVRGNATIRDVRDNATIQYVRGNATIQCVRDNATIQDVWGNATIHNVWDNATIQYVRDNATIQDVRDNATIQNVWGNATIQNVWDNATIKEQSDTNIKHQGKKTR